MRQTYQLVLFSIILLVPSHGLGLTKANVRTLSQSSQVTQDDCVYFYTECQYKGDQYKICGDFQNLGDSEVWPLFQIPCSMKFPSTTQLELYTSPNYQGIKSVFSEDQYNLDPTKMRTLFSLRFIRKGMVTLYGMCNYEGDKITVTGSTNDIGSDYYDKVKSVKIPNGNYILAFDEVDYRGKVILLQEGMDCLDKYYPGLFFKSFLRIQDYEIVLFSEPNFRGKYYKWAAGKNSTFKTLAQAFPILSIVIPDGKMLQTYSDDNFSKNEKIYTQDVKNLGEDQYNKINSFIISNSTYCVEIYDQCNFEGNKAKVCGKSRWIGSEYATTLQSIKIPLGTNFTIFPDVEFKGKSMTFTTDVSCLINTEWQSTNVFSVMTEVRECPRLYSQCGFKGDVLEVCADTYPELKLDSESTTKDFIGRSAYVPQGEKLKLYSASNYTSVITTITNSISCIYDME